MVLFLSPSLLFYLSSNVPIWIEQYPLNFNTDEGVKILSARIIDDAFYSGDSEQVSTKEELVNSRGTCVSLIFQVDERAIEQYCPGQYVKVYAPQISSISHPFSVNLLCKDRYEMEIIFRICGRFTKDLSDVLRYKSPTDPPRIKIEGFYGLKNKVRNAMRHDTVLIIAGGIGVTAYLSFLRELHEYTCLDDSPATVYFHWFCRDVSLIKYIKKNHFDTILSIDCDDTSENCSKGNRNRIEIIVHDTSEAESGIHYMKTALTSECCEIFSSYNMKGGCYAMSPTAFAPGVNLKVYRNIPHFILYSVNICTGMFFIWHVYHIQSSMKNRLYGLIVSVTVIFTLSMMYVSVFERGRRVQDEVPEKSRQSNKSAISHSTITFCRDNHNKENGYNSVLGCEDFESVPNEKISSGLNFTSVASIERDRFPVEDRFRILKGRNKYSIPSILGPFENDSMCIFACGPSPMITAIKDTLKSNSVSHELFEEEFEI